MVILAVDYGTKNIGIAYSPDGVFSFPIGTIKKTELYKDLEAIGKAAKEKKAELIILGYPASEKESDSAKFIRAFGERLEAYSGIKVVLQNEALTSKEVRDTGHLMGKNDKAMRGQKDALEAQLILMRYLESKGP